MNKNRNKLIISCFFGYSSDYLFNKYEDKIDNLQEKEQDRLKRGLNERISLVPTEDFILVESFKDNKNKDYKIYNYDDKQSCSCTDYHLRGVSCKHLWKYRLMYKEDILPETDIDIRKWTIEELDKDIEYMDKYGSEYHKDRFKNLKKKCLENKPIDILFEEIHKERGKIFEEYTR